jgi:hypothetical protein
MDSSPEYDSKFWELLSFYMLQRPKKYDTVDEREENQEENMLDRRTADRMMEFLAGEVE